MAKPDAQTQSGHLEGEKECQIKARKIRLIGSIVQYAEGGHTHKGIFRYRFDPVSIVLSEMQKRDDYRCS